MWGQHKPEPVCCRERSSAGLALVGTADTSQLIHVPPILRLALLIRPCPRRKKKSSGMLPHHQKMPGKQESMRGMLAGQDATALSHWALLLSVPESSAHSIQDLESE